MNFPSLAEVIAGHRWTRTLADPKRVRCTGCDWSADLTAGVPSTVLVAEHVEQVWLQVRTIETADQLDALPPDCVVQLGVGVAAQKRDGLDWFMANDEGYEFSGDMIAMNDHAFPALLVHHPDWSKP